MTKSDIIRSWMDADFRATLEDAPAHPAGIALIDDPSLDVGGGEEVCMAQEAEEAKSFWCTFFGSRKTDTRCCPRW